MVGLYFLTVLFDMIFFGTFRKILIMILSMFHLQTIYICFQYKLMFMLKYFIGFGWLPIGRKLFIRSLRSILGRNFYSKIVMLFNSLFTIPIFDIMIYYGIRLSFMDKAIEFFSGDAKYKKKRSHMSDSDSDNESSTSISEITSGITSVSSIVSSSERETKEIKKFLKHESSASPVESFNNPDVVNKPCKKSTKKKSNKRKSTESENSIGESSY
jgi:hypothetical protein